MFEYVKSHEVEQRRRTMIYGAIFLMAVIVTIAAIVLSYV
jgi:hypothetical protein